MTPPSSTTTPPPSPSRRWEVGGSVSTEWQRRDGSARRSRRNQILQPSGCSRTASHHSALDPYTRLIHVEHLPQIGDLTRGIAEHHEHVGLTPREQAASDGAHADGVGRARGAGHDGLRVGEASLGEHVDLVNELAGSVPAPWRVRAGRHEYASLAHLTHGVHAHVEGPSPRLELRRELRGELALALARLALALDSRLDDVE